MSYAKANEVEDDHVILGSTDLRILLSRRAIEDLNAPARDVQTKSSSVFSRAARTDAAARFSRAGQRGM